LDYSLVSIKNFSKILPSNGWRPGPSKVGQGGLKVLHLWHHSQKIRMALVRQPKTAVFTPKSKYEYIVRRLSKC